MFTQPVGLWGSAPVAGYPLTAADTKTAAGGYGTYDTAWRGNAGSGSLAALFGGAPSLAPGNTPTYGNAGPVGVGDLAVGFGAGDANVDYFTGGDVFDLTAAADACGHFLFKITTTPGAVRRILDKRAAAAHGYFIQIGTGVGGALSLVLLDTAAVSIIATATHASNLGNWCLASWCVERGAVNQARIATQFVTSSAQALGAFADAGNTSAYSWGRVASTTAEMLVAYNTIGIGNGYAAGMAANIAASNLSFKNYLGL